MADLDLGLHVVESTHMVEAERAMLSWELRYNGKAILKYAAPYIDRALLPPSCGTSDSIKESRRMLGLRTEFSKVRVRIEVFANCYRHQYGRQLILENDEMFVTEGGESGAPRCSMLIRNSGRITLDDQTTLRTNLQHIDLSSLFKAVSTTAARINLGVTCV